MLHVLVLTVVTAVPVVLLLTPFLLCGRRHGWGMRQYMWPMVAVGWGWGLVLGTRLVHLPVLDTVIIASVMLVLGILYGRGMVGWDDYFREWRAQRK